MSESFPDMFSVSSLILGLEKKIRHFKFQNLANYRKETCRQDEGEGLWFSTEWRKQTSKCDPWESVPPHRWCQCLWKWDQFNILDIGRSIFNPNLNMSSSSLGMLSTLMAMNFLRWVMVARAETRTNFLLSSGNFSGSELFSTRFTCSSNLQQITCKIDYERDSGKPLSDSPWLSQVLN